MELSDAGRRERGDRRKWVVRHLSIALEVEDLDEKDFHVSYARQLLEKTATASTTEGEGGGTETPFGGTSERQQAQPNKK